MPEGALTFTISDLLLVGGSGLVTDITKQVTHRTFNTTGLYYIA